MSKTPLALQLYSLRDDCAKDFPAVIKTVGAMGYDAVEFAGYFGHSASEIRKMLDDANLKSAGTHTSLDSLSDDNIEKTAAFNAELGCSQLIVPYTAPDQFGGREGVLRLAEKLTQASQTAAEFGALVGYHNHAWEFQTGHGDGELPMELLAINTPPDVILQVDTGNAQEAGTNSIPFIEKWKNRIVSVHLKPFAANFENYYVGEDDSDWPAIFAALEGGRTQTFIIEQERYPEPNSPEECVARCLKNLREMGK